MNNFRGDLTDTLAKKKHCPRSVRLLPVIQSPCTHLVETT